MIATASQKILKISKHRHLVFLSLQLFLFVFRKTFQTVNKLLLEGNIFSPGRYSYLSALPDDRADIFASPVLISYCIFKSLISSSVFMVLLYIDSKGFFPKRNGLSNDKVLSLTKKEYGSTVYSLQILIKSLKSISDEWFIAIWWSSLLFGIFIIKWYAAFNLTSFGTLKFDCVIKTSEILSFLPLINSSIII